ncbi:MAG: hypothetical protein H9W81_12640 [Enterococcus sp.]|nr:hypothetical protein [Enterococcus sp.]
MKRLNLETTNQQATLVTHLINKARIDLGELYNIVSVGLGTNIPVPLIFQKIQNSYPEIYGNTTALQNVFEMISDNFSEDTFKQEKEILDNIQQSLDAMAEGQINDETILVVVSKILMLLGLVFADLQKLADVFEQKCLVLGVNIQRMMEWNEDDPIDLSVEEELPTN